MLQTSPECRRCRPRCFTGSRAGWSLSRRPVGRVDIGGRRSAIRSAWPAPSAEDVARIGRDVRQRSRFLRRLCRLLPSRLRPAVAARAAPGVRGRSDVRVVLLSYIRSSFIGVLVALQTILTSLIVGSCRLSMVCLLVLSAGLVCCSCLVVLSAALVCSCLLRSSVNLVCCSCLLLSADIVCESCLLLLSGGLVC